MFSFISRTAYSDFLWNAYIHTIFESHFFLF